MRRLKILSTKFGLNILLVLLLSIPMYGLLTLSNIDNIQYIDGVGIAGLVVILYHLLRYFEILED